MDEKRMQEVFSDEAFVATLFDAENPEEVQALIKEKGLDFSLEQIEEIKNQLVKTSSGDALSADELDDVAGGFIITLAGVAAVAGIIGGTASAANFIHNVTRRRW